MNKYRCTFQGREVNAAGIMSRFSIEVEADTPEAARLKIYDTHEHLMDVRIEPVDSTTYTTSINGLPAAWSPEIVAKFNAALRSIDDPRPVVSANYFTPRPWLNHYDTGSKTEGFTYVRGRDVFQVIIRRHL